jgi:PKD repeat protein
MADPTTGYAPLIVYFYDLSDKTATSWSWDFGDGTNSPEQDPIHEYKNAGIYTVSLTATGPGGSDTETKTNYITVTQMPSAPVAGFSGTPTSGQPPLTVNFTDQSTGTVTGWSWDFGDGGTSTLQNPSYTYNSAGVYTVSLTVTGPGGPDTITRTDYIDITAPAQVEIFYDSFESSADWTVNWTQDAQNDWRRRTARVKEGSYAVEVDGRAVDAQLISKDISMQGKTNATASFWWYIESGLDTREYLAFDVSADSGAWAEMARLRGNVDPEDTWHFVSVNVTALNNLRIRFRATMSRSREDAYVDVVEVTPW